MKVRLRQTFIHDGVRYGPGEVEVNDDVGRALNTAQERVTAEEEVRAGMLGARTVEATPLHDVHRYIDGTVSVGSEVPNPGMTQSREVDAGGGVGGGEAQPRAPADANEQNANAGGREVEAK